jgi:hypothetical protein
MNELYYKINYYHNRFFILNNDYYVYLVNTINNNYIYQFELRHDKILYLKIINKNKYLFETFYIKIIHKNKEYNLIIKDNNLDNFKIGNIFKFNYSNEFIIKNNDIFFDINYYKYNNKLLNNNYLDNIEYINYHWYLCGRVNPYLYFKYLLKKYEDMIFKLEIPKFDMNSKETNIPVFPGENTLLFIDSRYDPSFIYLVRLFLYSVDETWNITIFTKESNKKDYENDLNKLGIIGNINIIENDLNNNIEYSNLLKDINFWRNIKEDNCLLFQYDSFCMKKFDPIFFNYNYIGARWPHKASKYEKINIGNGGTSFRKTRIMEEMIINNGNSKKNLIEDVFFAELLYENNLYNCSEEIADKFSFENIFNNNSCYAHQIYNSIKLEDLDTFIYEKLKNMFDKS